VDLFGKSVYRLRITNPGMQVRIRLNSRQFGHPDPLRDPVKP
jgi:hypothetical protein